MSKNNLFFKDQIYLVIEIWREIEIRVCSKFWHIFILKTLKIN